MLIRADPFHVHFRFSLLASGTSWIRYMMMMIWSYSILPSLASSNREGSAIMLIHSTRSDSSPSIFPTTTTSNDAPLKFPSVDSIKFILSNTYDDSINYDGSAIMSVTFIWFIFDLIITTHLILLNNDQEADAVVDPDADTFHVYYFGPYYDRLFQVMVLFLVLLSVNHYSFHHKVIDDQYYSQEIHLLFGYIGWFCWW